MTRSMTGYARATSGKSGGLRITIEIQGLNRKGLDIQLVIPSELVFLELEMRKWITAQIWRGSVAVKVMFEAGANDPISIDLLKNLKSEWDLVAESLSLPKEQIDLPFLLDRIRYVTKMEPFNGEYAQLLKQVMEEALHLFIQMKKKEGDLLARDVGMRLAKIEELVESIGKRAEKAPEKYRGKLLERLEGLHLSSSSDERVLREVALFAEKVDIAEELLRLASHLSQAREWLQNKDESIGRSLDFLVQEMGREINTISAKSSDLSVIESTLQAKGELDKIKEQVQNIE